MARETDAPNVIFVFADQWHAQATGYAGDPNVHTPHLDRLAGESVNLVNAVAGCPVCGPYRASLLTGRYPLSHGVFVNDVHLEHRSPSIAEAFKEAGYDTAYVGKWHVNGRGRLRFIPPEDRQGFEFWRGMECTHRYNESGYYADTDEMLTWDGYDAEAQTRCVADYIRSHDRRRPFFLALSWGPPHSPYQTAPRQFREMYDEAALSLRPNVPEADEGWARRDLAGYYAHCSALDSCLGQLLAEVDEQGLADDTIFVFTSDHGDMHGSHGAPAKQWPYDESIRVPFLLRWPRRLGRRPRECTGPFNAVDVMPTLLGLCGVDIPASVEGNDFSGCLTDNTRPAPSDATLIACYQPFAAFSRQEGGREYRGLRTERHTYVRSLDGPWLLFDNEHDPHQLDNLCGKPSSADIQDQLESRLQAMLDEQGDTFQPGEFYIEQWGYTVDETGAVPYDTGLG